MHNEDNDIGKTIIPTSTKKIVIDHESDFRHYCFDGRMYTLMSGTNMKPSGLEF